ncbi:MAG: cobalamin biosynthesis protein [Marinospirillum sp.]|uniref:adenosylcobinamide-phosphate synthase CbiB n=1 Tax=Marinospirillum sp. TaxID=2183934 RepID=UPI001A03C602|nr:adenosylcobinamide-phosphate synthase CbiB [Marinospirillum sp.]MBE0507332.1 cobalamin biosynthesis protein [Marinospirillum sp.]
MQPALILSLALLLDRWLGEPQRWHPLVGFGWLVARIEQFCHASHRWAGVLALLLAVLPWVLLIWGLRSLLAGNPLLLPLAWLLDVLVIYLAVGWKSLDQHLMQVFQALQSGQLPLARERVGWIVSRDTQALDETGISRAGVESLLENGNDAVFGVLFWYLLLGLPGVVLFRLVNTLDAMWGYRTERYLYFGWAAARLDDLLNWFPARLTALSYALVALFSGRFFRVLAAARHSSKEWKSTNAGAVMAAGAVALNVRLGGGAVYHGQWQERPILGETTAPEPTAVHLQAASFLLYRAVLLWCVLIGLGGLCLLLI